MVAQFCRRGEGSAAFGPALQAFVARIAEHDLEADIQVAGRGDLHALALQAKLRASIGARRNFQRHGSGRRAHIHRTAQDGCAQVYAQRHAQVLSVACPNRAWRHFDFQQGVARRPAGRGRLALALEATRRAVTREMKRQGKVWIRIFPDTPVSAKPIEVRMGKGKGSVDRWVARVQPGRILFEIDGVSDEVALEALRLGAAKLPIRTKIVRRIEGI